MYKRQDENNVQAYKRVSRGDAAGAIARSKYVLTEHFHTPWTEHAFLEPECCVALPLENGGVRLLTTDQSAHCLLYTSNHGGKLVVVFFRAEWYNKHDCR